MTTDHAITRFQPLVTAQEAYPAFEREFLRAERSISAGFRIFDLRTKLRSQEAREIGEDWFDLIAHTLRRGVSLRVVLSDFDVIGDADLHRESWRSRRMLIAACELADIDPDSGQVDVTCAMHSAHAGLFPRLLFYPVAERRRRKLIAKMNTLSPDERQDWLKHMPGLEGVHVDDTGKLQAEWVLPHLFPGTHHQKLAVFDDTRIYIGGLDLDERRYDTRDHGRRAPQTWHDVQALAEGPVVEAAARHLESFLSVVAGHGDPGPERDGFKRTVSRAPRHGTRFRLSPVPVVTEIEHAHHEAIARSERLIYLENQFFRDTRMARAMANRARECPTLRLILILPGAPEEIAFLGHRGIDSRMGEWQQAKCLRILRRGFGPNRLLVASPVKPRPARDGDDGETPRDDENRARLGREPIIYVHSKVSIFDDHTASLSSANLNGRSLRWDTECGLWLTERAQVDDLAAAVMSHWLPDGQSVDRAAPEGVFDQWAEMIGANTRRAPQDQRGFLVDYDTSAAKRMGMPVPGLPDELV